MMKKKPARKSREAALQVITVAAIPPDFSKWPTETKAAELLGVSVRSVRRFSAEGKLRKSKRQVIAGRRPLAVYNPEDIARIKAEQEMQQGSQFKIGSGAQGQGLALVETAVATSVREAIKELLAPLMEILDERLTAATQTRQDAPPLFMTIRAASKCSGLSQVLLRRMIASGELNVLRDGRSAKLRRTDIEMIGVSKLANKAGG